MEGSQAAGALTESPIPSITLQITKQDAEKCGEISRALQAIYHDLSMSNDVVRGRDMKEQTMQFIDQLYDAATKCHHEDVSQLLERILSSGLPELEVRLGLLVYHDGTRESKLKQLFCALSTDIERSQSRISKPQAVSLFRSILSAITCCLHISEHTNVVVEGRPEKSPDGPPLKKIKTEDGETITTKASTHDHSEVDFRDTCQSPSFDSSLATLRDEDYKDGFWGTIRKEVEEVAEYAADQVCSYVKARRQESLVSVEAFNEWYDKSGNEIVPWLQLLNLSSWGRQASPASAAIPKSAAASSSRTPKESDKKPAAIRKSAASKRQKSRTVVSFDFSDGDNSKAHTIDLSEDNLYALRDLVDRTRLMESRAADMCKRLLKMAIKPSQSSYSYLVLRKNDFERSIDQLWTSEVNSRLSSSEKQQFVDALTDVFGCFLQVSPHLNHDEVDVQEFAVGFCFFCAGNKSAKLAVGFEMLDDRRTGSLSEEQLFRYIRSYLLTLSAISLLTPFSKNRSRPVFSIDMRKEMQVAVTNGARWTLKHFLKYTKDQPAAKIDQYSFESFATWYSTGGYQIAPWLELLDLRKVFSLIFQPDSPLPMHSNSVVATARRPIPPRERMSSLRRHHSGRRSSRMSEILFTFPMAAHRSLIVLKEDAAYVREVVDQLGLLSKSPHDLWHALNKAVEKRCDVPKGESTIYVDCETFLRSMHDVCPYISRKRSRSDSSVDMSADELLSNFFQCFDLRQVGRVPLDELMGGLTLLCGGKKSTKLAFAFGVFDTRPDLQNLRRKDNFSHSLSGEDLFLFLRSILIVTFSCCRQSLDMSESLVSQCIADTANMICNDVMMRQWDMRQSNRLDFDEFGQWYNEYGYERAPWLELLDLKKWVVVDNYSSIQRQVASLNASASTSSDLLISHSLSHSDSVIPPPPPEDALDPSFFDDNGIMQMDSVSAAVM
jgi:Ca2+-binding EF-hand superfamily protein